MFLIRMAFWLSLVILLLPAGNGVGDGQAAQPEAGLSAGEALGAARETLADLSSFCRRNPETCATGSAALQIFGQKAQNGARMVYEYLSEGRRDTATAAGGDSAAGRDTLRADDLEVPWRGPDTQG